ncbi:MAG: FHA domain-containing protein [Chloroflexi bacterium]|nr:FHA domain-containing protein [Chloroflexota bacterium]
MLAQSHSRIVIFLFVLSLLVLAGPPPQHVFSQGASRLVINDLDTSKFPQLVARVSVLDESGAFVSGLDSAAFTVWEDGAEIKSQAQLEMVGVAVAVIFDSSRNTVDEKLAGSKGATGKLILAEAREAVLRLLDSNKWLDKTGQKDQIMALGFVSDTVKVLAPFVDDYNKAYNAVQDFTPTPQESARNTPILAGIADALKAMQAKPELANRRKAIIVFSDGLDAVSPVDRERVSAQAQRDDIAIYTVFLGARETVDAQRNLKTLADATGGKYVAYTSAGSVDPVYDVIFSQKNQYVITAESRANSRGQHTLLVQAKLGSANPVTVQAERPFSADIQNPVVNIVSPAPGLRIDRRVPQWNSKLEDADNKTLNVQINWSFPDGHTRSISKIEYLVDGKPGLPITEPVENFPVDISALGNLATTNAESHTIQIKVTDTLDLTGESQVLPIAVRMIVPPTPTPVPPTATPVPLPTPTPTPVEVATTAAKDYGPLALSLLALLVAGIVVIRRPQIVTEAPRRIAERVKEITEPFLPDRERGQRSRKGRAYLSVMSGGEPGQNSIEILTENTRLGRDEGLVNVVFSDKSISRWHSTIKEESNGEFRIFDEGSKSGSYVNQEQVQMVGQRLEDGDVIELGGRVRLRFHLRGATSAPTAAPGQDADDRSTRPMDDLIANPDDDSTEPFMGRGAAGDSRADDDSTMPYVGRDARADQDSDDGELPGRRNTQKL